MSKDNKYWINGFVMESSGVHDYRKYFPIWLLSEQAFRE